MEITASEKMRNYVNSQNFSSTAEIMEAMKELFRDALQQVMEGEPEETLGYEKSERLSEAGENTLSKNYRNMHSKKSAKTQLGKALMADLKPVYQAVNEEEGVVALLRFTEKWGKQYPSCVKNWNDNWDILSTFFAYPAELRRIIYTTNIIEGLNRQFRKVTKNKPSFANDDSLRKMLYLASQKIVKHGTVSCRNWNMVLNQLNILFANRIPA